MRQRQDKIIFILNLHRLLSGVMRYLISFHAPTFVPHRQLLPVSCLRLQHSPWDNRISALLQVLYLPVSNSSHVWPATYPLHQFKLLLLAEAVLPLMLARRLSPTTKNSIHFRSSFIGRGYYPLSESRWRVHISLLRRPYALTTILHCCANM